MKKILISSILISSILLSFIIYEKYKFPFKLVICQVGYINCFVNAKFEDIESCEHAREKSEWYCDQTDQQNIKCRAEKSNISVGYCTK